MTVIDLNGKGLKLRDLLKQDEVLMPQNWPGDEDITRVTLNSNDVSDGDVFLAIPPLDNPAGGLDYMTQAVNQNAKIIIKESQTPTPVDTKGVTLINIANTRHLKAMIAKRVYKGQPKVVVGVTGTNGKTSVAEFMRQLWEEMGYKAATLGTLGIKSSVKLTGMPDVTQTSPDPLVLHQALSMMKEQGITHLVIEASSHGIHQNRLDGVDFTSCAFTNLSHDHLDYHGSMDRYFDAKKRLFETLMEEGDTAVLNADTNYFDALSHVCKAKKIQVIPYGKRAEGGIHLENLVLEGPKQMATVVAQHEKHTIEFNFIGKFQVLNALCAMGLIMGTGESHLKILPLLSKLKPVPGRLELMGITKSGGAVYVDYAHSPDALSEALLSVRPYVTGMLTLVFGCGGDRDVQKRPLMGKIASEYSDAQIITDDNPRREDPAKIRYEIMSFCSNPIEVADREKAIVKAIKRLTNHDACFIAGKGHETTQTVGGDVLPFDDRELARKVLKDNGGKVF